WMAFRAFGVKAGDEILVPSHTAFPTVEAICFAEATPVFVDVDAWYGMDVADAAQKVTPRTVGIVPVHIYGQPVDVPGVRDLAGRHRACPVARLRRDEGPSPRAGRALRCGARGAAARAPQRAGACAARLPSLRRPHRPPGQACGVAEGARHPDGGALSGAQPSSACRGKPRSAGAAADGAPDCRDPDPAELVGAQHHGGQPAG